MTELLKVWCINGHDNDESWEVELFSTYEKAKNVFNEYINEYIKEIDGNGVYEVRDDYARYDNGNHYGAFWISKVAVR